MIVIFVPATSDGDAVAVPPFATGRIPVTPPFAVDAKLIGGTIAETMEQNEGAADEPVQFAKTVSAPALERANVNAGVVVAVATLVVNSGERFPALKVVTLPVPLAVELMVSFGQVPVIVTFVPATSPGVAVPVPPLATASMPLICENE